MYVAYKCEECGASVDSNMEECPACGELLPGMTLERDYDGEIDDELYELEHPMRTKARKMIEPYVEHLFEVLVQEVEVQEEIDEEAKRVWKEKGHFRSVLWRWKRNLARNLLASMYVILLLVPILALEYVEDPMAWWVSYALIASVPLYFVSLWLLVKADSREVPLYKKMLQHALGAFNKLALGLFIVGLWFLLVTIVNKYWTALWGLE